MGPNPVKNAIEQLYRTVFRDEPIRPMTRHAAPRLPSVLRAARSLADGAASRWQSREAIFVKQGRLLASYEDDYPFSGSVTRYYPTYQSLTDEELRGYFTWRTAVRHGDIRKSSLTFAILYVYELINQIGVASPADGYEKLRIFSDAYNKLDEKLSRYTDRWLADYVIYYGLDPALLHAESAVCRDLSALAHIDSSNKDQVVSAVKALSGSWLTRSAFYASNRADMDTVLFLTLRRISAHYATRTKKVMLEQFFGVQTTRTVTLFDAAVFYQPRRLQDRDYLAGEFLVYRCRGGVWSVTGYHVPSSGSMKLHAIVKAVDAQMRTAYGFGHPIQQELETKWIQKIIAEEIDSLLVRKNAEQAKKVSIDYASLAKIRADAAQTRDRLIVDEEAEEPPAPVSAVQLPAQPMVSASAALSADENRFLRCVLTGGDTLWVRTEGKMLSLLVDSINEKLYDSFADSVLNEDGSVVEDYAETLKEVIQP